MVLTDDRITFKDRNYKKRVSLYSMNRQCFTKYRNRKFVITLHREFITKAHQNRHQTANLAKFSAFGNIWVENEENENLMVSCTDWEIEWIKEVVSVLEKHFYESVFSSANESFADTDSGGRDKSNCFIEKQTVGFFLDTATWFVHYKYKWFAFCCCLISTPKIC